MSRERDILSAIDEMGGFDFQKLARRLLKRDLYPRLNPLPDQDDLGQDARTDELPVTQLPKMETDGGRITFAISKTSSRSKLIEDCDRCRDVGHDIDTLVFVTSGEVKNDLREKWRGDVREEYGWDLIVHDRTWLSDVVANPEYEKLIEEILGVPPLGGDYYYDIVSRFDQETQETASNVSTTLPQTDHHIRRDEIAEILSRLTTDSSVVVAGPGGVGKSGAAKRVAEQLTDSAVLFLDARRFSEVTDEADLRDGFGLEGALSDAIERVGRHDQCFLIVDQLDNISGTPAAGCFADLLKTVYGSEGVHVAALCRDWELANRSEYEFLTASEDFSQVSIPELSDEQVRNAVDAVGIADYSEELIAVGRNLVDLSIIAELAAQPSSSEIDFGAVKSQVELWELYQETLPERESTGAAWDEDTGNDVRARAVELAEEGLRQGSRVFPIGLRRERPDRRLISRDVLVHERGERYRFRHEELQDFFYAWSAVNRRGWTTPDQVFNDIDERVAAGVLRWMLRLFHKQGPTPTGEFLRRTLLGDDVGYYAVSNVLDEITAWNPADVDDGVLELAITAIDATDNYQRYFYANLRDSSWVRPFYELGFFDEPNGYLMAYLRRVAPDTPEVVTEIIRDTGTDDIQAQAAFIDAACKLPAEHATECIEVFARWLSDAETNADLIALRYRELAEQLVEAGETDGALSLLTALLEPQPPNPRVKEYELENGESRTWKHRTEATALASVHTLERTVDAVVDALPADYDGEFTALLETQLRRAIELEASERDRTPAEFPWPVYIGESKLQYNALKEVLLGALRSHLERWIKRAPDDPSRADLLRRYLDDILLFRRLGVSLLRVDPEAFLQIVRDELLSEANYDERGIRLEFFLLLRDGFPVLERPDQEQVCEIIEDGPDRDAVRETMEANKGRFPDRDLGAVTDEYIEEWQLCRLWMIREHLSDERSDRVERLVDDYGEPDDPVPDSSGMSAVRSRGPLPLEELRELSAEELLSLCLTWDPDEAEQPSDFSTEITARGLAEDLAELIEESPEDFVPRLSILSGADSIYVRHAFYGLKAALEDQRYFEWERVVELCEKAASRSSIDDVSCRREVCRLFEVALKNPESGVLEHRDSVRDILLHLSEDPDPGFENGRGEVQHYRDTDDDGEDDSDRRRYITHERPIEAGINAVRPIAIETLIQYALTRAGADGFEGYREEEQSGLERDVRACLVERLDDPSTAVQSLYGKFLRNLYWLDREMVEENIDAVFPIANDPESRDRFSAAWSAFITTSPWVEELYRDLREHYFHAIDLYAEDELVTISADDRFLIAHSLRPYLFLDEPLDSADSLLPYLYANSSPDTARSVAWQLWSWGNEDPEFREKWRKIRELWQWRLSAIEGQTNDTDEDTEHDVAQKHADEFRWFVGWLELVREEVPPRDVESLLYETVPLLTYDRRGWNTIEAYLAFWVDEQPRCCIDLYATLVRQFQFPNIADFDDETFHLLTTALERGGETREIALEATETIAEYDSDYLDLVRDHAF